ncbi:MAG: DUF4191 domain-containing protein [Candidatus Nanopelagicales bacterium]|nr:DUF4191 domain-containing protein [Candidatus Nanopelagicales bacterium]
MARKDGKPGRLGQIRETYKLTKRNDPRIGWILAGIFVGIVAVFAIAGVLLGMVFYFIAIGVSLGALAVTIVFGRRAERSAYAQIEGQPGAAAAVLKSLKKGWFVTPAVAITKNQDVVHRVVGRPGVMLVSEGPSHRAQQVLNNERKKTARFVPDIPIIEIQSGNDEGQIPLRKLNRKVMKQKRNLKPAQVTEVRRRLDALATQPMSAPKGPMPKSVRAARNQRG